MSDHKQWTFRVKDMLRSMQRIEETLAGMDFSAFSESEDAQDIVARHFQVIGEAARKIPDEVKNANTQIPWQKMIGLRNFVVHEYHRVDQRIIWDTATGKLPEIRRLLSQMDLPDDE